MKYEQYVKRVEEGDLIAKFENQPMQVNIKDDLYVTTATSNQVVGYSDINQLWKLDSKGNYMKVEVER